MECAYWKSSTCRSCSWIELPYPDQLAARERAAQDSLAALPHATGLKWLPSAPSAEAAFRTKAKMVVGGTGAHPTLGILGPDRRGVDLRECPIMDRHVQNAMPGIAQFVSEFGLEPYDIPARSGELKYVLVTSANSGELLVRFVLRSRRHVARLRNALERLRELVPATRVVTANIHPTHEAIVEGPEEIVLSEQATLPMQVGDVRLHLGPRSFSQTNDTVAGELYRHVAKWCVEGAQGEGGREGGGKRMPLSTSLGSTPRTNVHEMWDLYCGIGGFALHGAKSGIHKVTGVEVSEQAIGSARQSVRELGLGPERAQFIATDATEWARTQSAPPDVVVVNPPRRGIGSELAQWLNESGVKRVVYSSCYPDTLAKNLEAMPGLVPIEARLFDMFPHTAHSEVAVLLERAAG